MITSVLSGAEWDGVVWGRRVVVGRVPQPASGVFVEKQAAVGKGAYRPLSHVLLHHLQTGKSLIHSLSSL